MTKSTSNPSESLDFNSLAADIKRWGKELGFQQIGITDTNLGEDEAHLLRWLNDGYHGKMDYMQRHGTRRSRPGELVPGTISVISVRMDYWPSDSKRAEAVLNDPAAAYISRYALGRDYHKVLRGRLQRLKNRISAVVGTFGCRVFTDSAPVLEKALAQKAGVGWIGKHTNVLHDKAGSWFFLGELYTSLPLPTDTPATNHCGTCRACIDVCPTQAIVAPYKLDARRCISYLTIELRGSIPESLRPAVGNRIYGCDDCQLVCPWNRFATDTCEEDFRARHQMDAASLVTLSHWSEDEFLTRTRGSPIRRIGYECWLRNIAVALGNAPSAPDVINALESHRDHPSELVREHVAWALRQHV